MATTGFKLNVIDFEKQIEQLKKKIIAGVHDGLEEIRPEMEELFKYYETEHVYKVYQPKEYQRTGNLLNATKSEVEGTKLFVYADSEQLPANADTKPVSILIDEGYHHWGRKDFTPSRDWISPMAQELKNHLEQSGIVVNEIKKEIQKKID
jgi:hypothetical protein